MAIEHLLALHSLSSVSNKKFKQLMQYFGDAAQAWENPQEWRDALGISQSVLLEIRQEQKQLKLLDLYERFLKSGARIVTMADDDYPNNLRQIYDAPYLLFYKGRLTKENQTAIALVGSRKATAYGKEVAEILGKDLAHKGALVISGLARGIDSSGHRGALAGGGQTIGVLGCGIDVIYPPENKQLFAQMEEEGCIISEFPLGMEPISQNFPIRNRIISGLCHGLVVVEAAERSGTQITVDYALEQGRDIFAIPGPIFSPLSQGTHRLIRDYGIKLVTSADDILEEYGQLAWDFGSPCKPKQKVALSPNEEKLLAYVVTAKHFNDILAEMEMQVAELGTFLTVCEMRGYISRLDGQYYIVKNG